MITYKMSYTFRDKPTSCLVTSDLESSDMVVENAAKAYPGWKNIRAERMYESKSVSEELIFTWTQEVADFLIAIASSNAHFYIEGNNKVSNQIEDKYLELTRAVLVPEQGVYNIAPEEKWGVEGSLYYDRSLSFPEDFGIEPEKPGQVNSTRLFWTLIRLGFRIDGKHDINKILSSIPAEFKQVAGVA